MNSATRIKLSVMMFLEYAISSVWALMLYVYLKDLFGQGHEFSIGLIMACGGLGSILGPFIMGQLADRYFATERVLAFSHLGGGVLLIAASYFTTFWPIFVLMLLYCTLYFPTVGLTNSLTFRALGRRAHQPVRADPPLGHDRLAPGNVPGRRLSGTRQRQGPPSQALF